MSIYVQHNGQQLGPFTEEQLTAHLASGAISPQDHVWWEGQKDWVLLSQTQFGGALPTSTPVAPVIAPVITPTTAATSNLAIWALVCGCASVICNIFSAVPAIILGHMGLKEIKKNPGMQGYGMALAGTILGYVFTAFGVLYIGVVAISVLIALGNQVKSVTGSTSSQPVLSSPDQTTNAPDDNTNSAPGK